MQIPTPSRLRVQVVDAVGYAVDTIVKQQPLEAPVQQGLPFYGRIIDIDHMYDAKYGEQVQYWGKAVHVFDDIYRCLANVGGALCVVEVTIRPHDHLPPSPAT